MGLPVSSGIRMVVDGPFAAWMWVLSGSHESTHSGLRYYNQDYVLSFDDLAKNGFQEGEECWVSADIESGAKDHQSGQNFILAKDGGHQATYQLQGTASFPSWNFEG
jgi:hypothetical protein